jgi:iron complex outermembrane recepter protein
VKRVDIVTAGASSAYGSDAVAGVVNYVIDKGFTGFKAEVQRGISTHNDDGSYRVSLAGGLSLGERVHIVASFDQYQNDGYNQDARPYLNDHGLAVGSVAGSAAPPGSAANPLTFEPGINYNLATFGGIAETGPFAGTNFPTPGAYGPVVTGAATGTAGFYRGGDYYYAPGTQSAVAGLRNTNGFANVTVDVTDNVKFHIDAVAAQSTDNYNGLPNLLLFQQIYSGNPFLPAALQAQLTATDTPAFGINKELSEMGPLTTLETLDNFDTLMGFDGKFKDFTWNVNYTRGDSEKTVSQGNQILNQQLAAALDAVVNPASGQIVCAPTLNPNAAVAARYADCVPFNPFGVGASSAASRAYVTGISDFRASNIMNDVNASISGTVLQLPAGPASAAMGIEYRNESLDLTSNSNPAVPVDTTGLRGLAPDTPLFYLTNIGPASGHEDVKEIFGEVAVPVVKDLPALHALDLNGAARYTDYSTSGGVNTWKGGFTWAPFDDDLRFRLTRSRDIRAPTLFDLFAGQQYSVGAGYDPTSNMNGTFPTRTSGNPNLKPEIGNTLSWGFVYQPSYVPGLAFSVDAYDVHITQAITTLSAQTILQDCYDSNGTAPTCGLITRPCPTCYPTAMNLESINIAGVKTDGADIQSSYTHEVGPGKLTLNLYATFVDHYQTQEAPDQPVVEYSGYDDPLVSAIPKWRATFNANYEMGAWAIFAQERMVGSQQYNPLVIYAQPSVPAVFYTDLTVRYQIPILSGNFEIFATINNLLDKQAPLIYGSILPGLGLSTIPGLYDTTGRYFTLGFRIKL